MNKPISELVSLNAHQGELELLVTLSSTSFGVTVINGIEVYLPATDCEGFRDSLLSAIGIASRRSLDGEPKIAWLFGGAPDGAAALWVNNLAIHLCLVERHGYDWKSYSAKEMSKLSEALDNLIAQKSSGDMHGKH